MSVHDVWQLSKSDIGQDINNRVFRKPDKPVKVGDIVNLHLLDGTIELLTIKAAPGESIYSRCSECTFRKNSRLCCTYREPLTYSYYCLFSEGCAVDIGKMMEDL